MGTDQLRQVYSAGQMVLRLALCGLIVYCGFVAARGFSFLLGSDPVKNRSVGKSEHESTDPVPTYVSRLIEDGYWSFAGWGWELQQTVGSEGDLVPARPTANCKKPDVISKDEVKLLELLVMLKAAEHREDGYSCYSLDLHPAKLFVAACRDDADTWIDQAMLGVPMGPVGQWKMMRIRRSSRLLDPQNHPELIPEVNFARRIIARLDESGNVQAELLQCGTSISTLRTALEQTGYSFRRPENAIGFQNTWLATKQSETFVMLEPSLDAPGIMFVSRLLTKDEVPAGQN